MKENNNINNNFKSPFIDKKLLIRKINNFLKKYNTSLSNKANYMYQFFEMSVYNDIIEFYKREKYNIQTFNLIEGKFRYKVSPMGNPENFSYFIISKSIRNNLNEYEIHHNLKIETVLSGGCYLTPDISIIKKNSIVKLKDKKYHKSGNIYHYVKNEDLISFCEVKNLNPFPELLFSFIGLFIALNKENKINQKNSSLHFAPVLAISGNGNYHTNKIKEELMNKYQINIIFNLFKSKNQIYKKNNLKKIK